MPWYFHKCKIIVPRLLDSSEVLSKIYDVMETDITLLKDRVTNPESKDSDSVRTQHDLVKKPGI